MSYYRKVEEAIDFIEEGLKNPSLKIDPVCQKVGVSKWYFQRIFKSITGDSIGDYIRKRRLSLAADELFKTDRPILDISLDYGFEGQESFTRAFKNHFDLPPAKYRNADNPLTYKHKFQLTHETLDHFKNNLEITPKIYEQEEMKLIGFSAPFRGTFEEDQNAHEVIPALWKNLMSRYSDIKLIKNGFMYGVMLFQGLEGNNYNLTYKAMVEVESFPEEIPEGMETFTFPKGKLAKFTHRGDPTQVDKTVKYIFGTWLPQAKEELREGLEIEIYPPNYNPMSPDSNFEYCLAIK